MRLVVKGFREGLDDSFAVSTLPMMIGAKMMGSLLGARASLMDSYLRANYGISLRQVAIDACNSIKASWFGDDLVLALDGNAYCTNSNERLLPLVKLMEYGNESVKGIKPFSRAMEFVKENMDSAYRLHLMEGSVRLGGNKLLR